MKNDNVIPQDYMSVGKLAKKMNTTVRTLQYYDREGLLSPSAQSEGGRRLYTDKDVIRLHQIQSMKYLGFSLEDIKYRLNDLETPADVAAVLTEQAGVIEDRIAALTEVLQAIEKLKIETLQMQTVDWKKYADIIVNLQMKNEYYGMIKHFDDEILDHLRVRFDKESGVKMIHTINQIFTKIAQLQKDEIPAESEQGQQLAKAWWDMVMDFTGGDMSQISGLMKIAESSENLDAGWAEKWASVEPYVIKAMEAYFNTVNIDPLEDTHT